MSNLVPTNIQIPAHLAGRIGQPSLLGQALAGGISSGDSTARISLKGARFRIVEGGTETVLDTTTIEVVIVGANPRLSKAWYSKAWDANAEASAPDCFSIDGVGPDASSTNPQNDLCASCPQNAWGSKISPTGAQIKQCSDKKRLAVVAADDPSGPVYLLEVTPTALKNLNDYHKELSVRGIAAEIVRTKLGFDTNASFPKLIFGFGGFLDEDTMLAVDNLFGSDKVKAITGEATNKPVALPAPTPKPASLKQVAAPAPAPVVEEVVEEAPAPKRGFGAAKAAAPAPAPKPKAAPKPVATVSDAGSLADDIASLLGEVEADDA
jgi:hypothetical protein